MPHELDQRFPQIKLFGGKLKKAFANKIRPSCRMCCNAPLDCMAVVSSCFSPHIFVSRLLFRSLTILRVVQTERTRNLLMPFNFTATKLYPPKYLR